MRTYIVARRIQHADIIATHFEIKRRDWRFVDEAHMLFGLPAGTRVIIETAAGLTRRQLDAEEYARRKGMAVEHFNLDKDLP